MQWEKCTRRERVKGTLITGDLSVPKSRWGLMWLIRRFWKTIQVFQVDKESAKRGYRIGFQTADGTKRLSADVLRSQIFRVWIGHEDCTFFALRIDDQEIPLVALARTDKHNVKHADAPLY